MCFFLFCLHSFAGGVLGLLFTRPSPTGSRGGTTRDPPPQDAAEAAGGSANGGGADAQGVSALPSQYAEATPPRMQRRPSQAAVWAALPRTPSGSWSTWRIGQTGKLLRGPMFTPISPIRHAPFFSYVSLGAFLGEASCRVFVSCFLQDVVTRRPFCMHTSHRSSRPNLAVSPEGLQRRAPCVRGARSAIGRADRTIN